MFQECFAAGQSSPGLHLKAGQKNATVHDPTKPYGCSVSKGGATLTFNTDRTETSCAGTK